MRVWLQTLLGLKEWGSCGKISRCLRGVGSGVSKRMLSAELWVNEYDFWLFFRNMMMVEPMHNQ